jgi:hypothetical protein
MYLEVNMKKYTREQLIDALVDNDLQGMEEESMALILREGCQGWNSASDGFLIQAAVEFLEDDDLIFINSEGKEINITC